MDIGLEAVNGQNALTVCLDDTGRILNFTAGSLSFDAFPTDFKVVDDLTGRIFRGRDARSRRTGECAFCHHWDEAQFTVFEEWLAEGKKLVRKFRISLLPGMEKRSVSLETLFSYPAARYSLKCWSANERFPTEIAWLGGLKLFYEDVCYGTVLPAFALYDEKKNCGVTVGTRFDAFPGGRLSFAFRDYQSEGVDAAFSCLLLSPERDVECDLLYAATEGCYRSALAFWVGEYPDFFEAPESATCRMTGPFFITNPQMEKSFLAETARKYAPAWAELHNHFPRYGEYAPEKEEWESVIRYDYPKVECDRPFDVAMVNKQIDTLHEHGIQAMVYLQASGDCFIPYAEECFPDAIARDAVGNKIKTWIDCCFTSAMPGTSFHKHLKEQIRKFFALYPGMDGVFLDQLCYHTMDYAHADGKSAVNCREVARFGDSYFDTLKLIADTLHKDGKALWANGPFSVGVSRDVDGMMSEGTGSIARTYQYLTCGSKGLLIHSYASNCEDVESMFRYCLICGGTWSISGDVARKVPEAYPEGVEALFDACGSLVSLLAGCRWVLEANPFTLPGEYEGNLYTLPDETLALTVVSCHDTLTRADRGPDKPFKAQIRCRDAAKIRKAVLHTVDGVFDCPCRYNGSELELEISAHRVFSVIILEKAD